MKNTLLTIHELAERIRYSATYINNSLKDRVFIEGKHYIRPFNGRRILYLWEPIEHELYKVNTENVIHIPMASGRICNGKN